MLWKIIVEFRLSTASDKICNCFQPRCFWTFNVKKMKQLISCIRQKFTSTNLSQLSHELDKLRALVLLLLQGTFLQFHLFLPAVIESFLLSFQEWQQLVRLRRPALDLDGWSRFLIFCKRKETHICIQTHYIAYGLVEFILINNMLPSDVEVEAPASLLSSSVNLISSVGGFADPMLSGLDCGFFAENRRKTQKTIKAVFA